MRCKHSSIYMMAFINAHVHASVRITTPLLLAGNVLNINVYWPYYGCIIMYWLYYGCIIMYWRYYGCIIMYWLYYGCIIMYWRYYDCIIVYWLYYGCIIIAGAVRPHCCSALMREWLLQYYQPLIPLAGSTRIVS